MTPEVEKIREKAERHLKCSDPLNKQEYFKQGYEVGYNDATAEAFRWRDVNDRTNPMPKGDLLIKTETGKIFRYNEDWEDEREIVTHWRPINQSDL